MLAIGSPNHARNCKRDLRNSIYKWKTSPKHGQDVFHVHLILIRNLQILNKCCYPYNESSSNVSKNERKVLETFICICYRIYPLMLKDFLYGLQAIL